MKEIRNIISTYHQIDWTKEQVALATVVSVEESAYRRIGARMLVRSSGLWVGGISGGCLEGDALKRARIAIMNKKPSIVVYDTLEDDAHQIGVGLGCNGRIEVLFTPINPEDKSNPIEQLIAIHQNRKPSIFYQVLNKQNDAIFGLFGKGSNKAEFSQKLEIPETALVEKTELVLQRKKSKVFNFESPNGRIEVLIEFIRPEVKIILVGDNYDVNAFSGIANELGWEIHLVGLQRKFNKSIFKLAKQVIHYDQVQELEIDNYTVIVLMSHDYKWDLKVLKVFLEKNPAYIGMLGPKKRTLKMQKELEEEQISFDIDNFHFLYSPIGLDIGAETPEEIALSAAAEIIAHFRNRNGHSLRLRGGTIHEREVMKLF